MTLSVSESLSAQPAGPDRSDSLRRSSEVSSKIVSRNRNCCCWPGISTVAPSVNKTENKLLQPQTKTVLPPSRSTSHYSPQQDNHHALWQTLLVAQLVKKFTALYGTQTLLTVLVFILGQINPVNVLSFNSFNPLQTNKNWKYFSIKCSPISERTLLF
jgi:hypothetical protein